MAILNLFIGMGVLIAGAIIARAWVMTVIWGWFVVPAFHMPELTIATALGLTILVGMFTHHLQDKKEEKADIAQSIIKAFLQPLITLMFAWIVTWFM